MAEEVETFVKERANYRPWQTQQHVENCECFVSNVAHQIKAMLPLGLDGTQKTLSHKNSKGNAFAKAIKTQGPNFFMGKNTNIKGLW